MMPPNFGADPARLQLALCQKILDFCTVINFSELEVGGGVISSGAIMLSTVELFS